MPSILITDTLFIGPEEERLIEEAGYTIERLDHPMADEEQLVKAIQGKEGYVLGGIETVTDAVIEAADSLRAIAFTGSGYAEFIPAWELATKRGIAISAAKGGNAKSVAEWTLAAGLTLVRNLLALSTSGGPTFYISREFSALRWGIVGFGNVGHEVARLASALGFEVAVTPSSRAADGPVQISELAPLLESSDVISVHVSKGRGASVLDRGAIQRLRPGAVVVNAAFAHAIDNEALTERLLAGELRAALDYPLATHDLPPGVLLASNAQTAFNTSEANERISARVAHSLVNLLATGNDDDLVNPAYRDHLQGSSLT